MPTQPTPPTPPTQLTYRMTETDDGFCVKCEELALEATGRTPAEALESLRSEAVKRLTSADAVAPPSRAQSPRIDLVAAPKIEAPDPEGPGDSPAAERLPDNRRETPLRG